MVCGEARFEDERADTLVNPKVIVEVLSKTTQDYDRGAKFEQYRTIESFVEYALIAQDKPHVEHFVRQPDGRWLLAETNRLDDRIELSRSARRKVASRAQLALACKRSHGDKVRNHSISVASISSLTACRLLDLPSSMSRPRVLPRLTENPRMP